MEVRELLLQRGGRRKEIRRRYLLPATLKSLPGDSAASTFNANSERVIMRAISVLTLGTGLFLGLAAASAQPSQIIVLRHGEKTKHGGPLCATGVLRASALAEVYLGKGASKSLFGAAPPAAFYAVTGHTEATSKPSANSWCLKVLRPNKSKSATNEALENDEDDDGSGKEKRLNQETEEAAKDVLTNPNFDGKIVVMTWEHKHIANEKLEKRYPNEKVTLRQLLKIDDYAKAHPDETIPDTWSGDNYDFFWIVDYADPKSPRPSKVTIVKQTFPTPYESVPANDWKTPEPPLEGCKP